MSLTVPTEFCISVEMESDWHIGSGAGRSEIDSLVQRDSDNLPYISGKSLTGILRDGCETVAWALDSGGNRGKWNGWVDFLFGDRPARLDPEQYPEDRAKIEVGPRPAALSIRSAIIDDDLRKALNARPNLKAAIAFMKPGVAIDPETGSAQPNCFRVEEMVRKGTNLIAERCTLDYSNASPVSDMQKAAAYALLLAGAKMTDRLGGKRRRGSGKCQITVDGLRANSPQWVEWLQWFESNYGGIEDAPPQAQSQIPTVRLRETKPDPIWTSTPLTISTVTPIVIPARTVGNVVECLDFIPGRYLIRYLHKQLGNLLNVSQAIAHNDLVITNATIAIGERAGRPTPLCLFSKKVDGGLQKGAGVYNLFQEEGDSEAQLKGERKGYVGRLDGEFLPEYDTVPLEIYTHNTIDDAVQRPTSDVGGVYSYQAIGQGTTLKASLRLPKNIADDLDAKAPNWWQQLDGKHKIGQSKKDLYGVVQIVASKPETIEPAQNAANSSELYVWLLSDLLLRNERLSPTTHPNDLKQELERQLGVELAERPLPEDSGKLSMILRTRRTESWQVRWGLPRPSMMGWQAGGCLAFQVEGGQTIDPHKLAELEACGIGDRCAEGYGQVSFNDPLLTTQLEGLEKPIGKTPERTERLDFTRIAESRNSFQYARTIELAAWREMIARKSARLAAEPKKRREILGIQISEGDSKPSMSQMGRLRSTVGRLTQRQAPNAVTGLIAAIKSDDKSKEKWPDGSLESIENLASNFERIWEILDPGFQTGTTLIITEHGLEELSKILWAEAVRTVIYDMIRAHKRSWEDTQEGGFE